MAGRPAVELAGCCRRGTVLVWESVRQSAIRDWLPYVWFRCVYRAREVVDSLWSTLLARWWNCHLGRGLRAYGVPILRKHPSATIRIGRNVILRSSEWSNTAGLNRRCVISVAERDDRHRRRLWFQRRGDFGRRVHHDRQQSALWGQLHDSRQ